MWKAFLNNLKQYVANITGVWIFACKYSHECEICVVRCANIRFKTNILKQIFASTNIRCNLYFLHQIEYLYANLCEYFEANMKQINGVCEYSKTCEYEANMIHIYLDSHSKRLNKSCEYGAPYSRTKLTQHAAQWKFQCKFTRKGDSEVVREIDRKKFTVNHTTKLTGWVYCENCPDSQLPLPGQKCAIKSITP